jgi:hypothetical protein
MLPDEAERSIRLPLILSGLVDIDGNARGDRLLDIRIDDTGHEIANDDGVRLLRDRRLHRARRCRLDVGLVDRDVVQLDAERLRRILRALVEGRKEGVVERPGDEGDRDRLFLSGRRKRRQGRQSERRRGGACEQSLSHRESQAHCFPPSMRRPMSRRILSAVAGAREFC